MYTIKVNGKYTFEIKKQPEDYLVNGEDIKVEAISKGIKKMNLLYQNKAYQTEVLILDKERKILTIKVNSNIYNLSIKDKYDALLHDLGLDSLMPTPLSELKAPMPGMVLSVFVKEGDEVLKGSNLLTLEAMKMENIIKAPADVIIKSVHIKPLDKIERNQLLVSFR